VANPETVDQLPAHPEFRMVSWDPIAGEFIWWDKPDTEPESYCRVSRQFGMAYAVNMDGSRTCYQLDGESLYVFLLRVLALDLD
jgi:hypothetical protein